MTSRAVAALPTRVCCSVLNYRLLGDRYLSALHTSQEILVRLRVSLIFFASGVTLSHCSSWETLTPRKALLLLPPLRRKPALSIPFVQRTQPLLALQFGSGCIVLVPLPFAASIISFCCPGQTSPGKFLAAEWS